MTAEEREELRALQGEAELRRLRREWWAGGEPVRPIILDVRDLPSDAVVRMRPGAKWPLEPAWEAARRLLEET